MELEKFAPFQTDFSAQNVSSFKVKRPDLVIPCMRMKKLVQLEDFLKKGIFLIKGPPGSGKTTMADLFEFYLNLKDENSICFRVNANNVHNLKELDQEFMFQVKKTVKELVYDDSNPKMTYVIIDEAHKIYGDKEGQDFESFWKLMKEVAEGTRKKYIRFLFCSVYSINRINEDVMKSSPLILQDKFQGFNFLRFSLDEYYEIVSYYCNTSMNKIFPITQEIQDLIWQETVGFPQLTMKTIVYLQSTLNNSEDKTVGKVHEVLYSNEFQKEVIYSLKAFPHKILKQFSYEELVFLRNIHLRGSVKVDFIKQSKLYDVAKKMESFGIVYEGAAYEFKFPSLKFIFLFYLQ